MSHDFDLGLIEEFLNLLLVAQIIFENFDSIPEVVSVRAARNPAVPNQRLFKSIDLKFES